MEYYSAIKNKEYFWSQMDGPRDYHSMWSKSDRERQLAYAITYVESKKKNDTNEFICKIETDS